MDLVLQQRVEASSASVTRVNSRAVRHRPTSTLCHEQLRVGLPGAGPIHAGSPTVHQQGHAAISAVPVYHAQGHIDHLLAHYLDLTERKQFEARLKHLASHDPLTRPPNRTVLADRRAMALARAERPKGILKPPRTRYPAVKKAA